MKYIRTKDGRVVEVKDYMFVKETTIDGVQKCLRLVYKDRPFVCVLRGDEDYIIKQADTIDELFDMYILVQDNGAYTPMNKNEAIDELALGKRALYGMIWVKGEHDEPILKAVAKLNDKGEWELLWQ